MLVFFFVYLKCQLHMLLWDLDPTSTIIEKHKSEYVSYELKNID